MHNLVLLDRNSHWAVVGSGLWFVFQSEASPPTANGPFKKAPANTDETSSALLLCSHQQETRRQSCFRCCARLLSLQGGGEGAQLVFFFPSPIFLSSCQWATVQHSATDDVQPRRNEWICCRDGRTQCSGFAPTLALMWTRSRAAGVHKDKADTTQSLCSWNFVTIYVLGKNVIIFYSCCWNVYSLARNALCNHAAPLGSLKWR